jgi:hypothetical protein
MAAWYSLSELPSRKWSEADWVVGMVDVISFGYWLVCYWGERVAKEMAATKLGNASWRPAMCPACARRVVRPGELVVWGK